MFSKGGWTVLFGGRGRQDILRSMKAEGIQVDLVVLPKDADVGLAESGALLKSWGFSLEHSGRNLEAIEIPRQDAGLLSVGWPYLVPPSILTQFRWALNVHPTLLPRYGGPSSGAHILINNETETGSTVHYMLEDFDSGPIVVQSFVEINPFDTVRSVQRKVYLTEPELVVSAISRVESGDLGRDVSLDRATYFSRKRTPDDSELDSERPLIELFDFIRGCDPYDFPAHFFHHGEKVCVRLWRPDKAISEEDMI